MKLKKFVAVAIAAVMSLAMFTACSGSSTLVTPRDCKEYTLKAKAVDDPYSSYQTADGTWIYSKSSEANATLIDRTNKKEYTIRYDKNGNVTGVTKSAWETPVPTVTTGKEEYNNKSYKTKVYKIVEAGGVRTETYLFDGSVLKYIKLTTVFDDGTTDSDVYEVQQFTRTADKDTLNKTIELVKEWYPEDWQE